MPNGNLDTEKYKQELMKLYSRSTSAEEKQVTEPVPGEINETDKTADDDTVYAEHTEEDSNGAVEDYNSRFPEPDLSALDTDFGSHSNEDDVPPRLRERRPSWQRKGLYSRECTDGRRFLGN